VILLFDGEADPNTYTVSSGSITPDTAGTNYVVGLSYDSVFETLPLVAYTDYGGSASYLATVHNLVLDLYNTMEFDLGTDSTHKSTQSIDELYTGVRPTEFPRAQFREPHLYIDVNDPTEVCLRGFTAQLSIDYVD
jgi:hypothetical protein